MRLSSLCTRAGLFLLFLTAACQDPGDRGEKLARTKCASCHLFPEPHLLDRKSWKEGVLPEMELRMGQRLTGLPAANAEELNEILQILPASPLLSEADWETIKQYYEGSAPETLEIENNRSVKNLERFAVSTVSLSVTGRTSLTTIRHASDEGRVYVGTREGKLFILDTDLEVTDSLRLPSPPSHILLRESGEPLIVCMGIMDPNDQHAGSVVASQNQALRVLMDSLKRPVYLEEADLNNDGLPDILVSAFGNFTGSLLAFENVNGEYRRRTIHNFSGNRKTITRDFNNDGLPDIMALITQGDERLALFTNRGNFKYSYQVLLKFPPVYGSSYFELADFNGDGLEDILLTSGDNADYSPVLKPYHGLRIFLNDGKNKFRQSWFYPMHGASMARAHDFDQDGDLDIAAISFFPDFHHTPQYGFLYFENRGDDFEAFSTPIAASSRWITMELADIDDDSDVDILLGALAFPSKVPDSLVEHWTKQRASLLVLKNTVIE